MTPSIPTLRPKQSLIASYTRASSATGRSICITNKQSRSKPPNESDCFAIAMHPQLTIATGCARLAVAACHITIYRGQELVLRAKVRPCHGHKQGAQCDPVLGRKTT